MRAYLVYQEIVITAMLLQAGSGTEAGGPSPQNQHVHLREQQRA